MSDIHNNYIIDPVVPARKLEINASREAQISDTDGLSKLTDLETRLTAIEANQTDKTQFTKVTDGTNNLTIKPNGSVPVDLPLTAFGDLRTAELTPQFQGSFEYTVDNTELSTNTVVNGGTVTQADAMCVVTSSTTTASTRVWVV